MTEDEIRFHRRLLVNVFDRDHRILFWNKKCEMLFNICEQEALGKTLEELLPWTQGHDKMAYLHNALSGQPVYVADEKYEQNDNYYDQVVLPLKDIKGNVFAALPEIVSGKNFGLATGLLNLAGGLGAGTAIFLTGYFRRSVTNARLMMIASGLAMSAAVVLFRVVRSFFDLEKIRPASVP